ncbi:alpha/beta fold hydrolase [Microbacterium timonense]|uniref:alpha/beta fold hydrolase n=1 Tax=Microbacterium timonense TaxID=2086576 RepID=UPI001358EC29|nr:alpha/beta fold hydrolase [Microbacterium timonense]
MESASVDVRYAWSGTDDVAWSELGDGEPVLIGGWWMSHLPHDWASPPFRAFASEMARHRRVIRMDLPGSGLSRSRGETPITLGPHVDAVAAVLDAARVDQVTIMAGSSGCPIAVEFAARYPERVHRLVLAGPYLDGGSVAAAPDREALVEMVRRSWGVSSRVMSDIFYPDATPEQRRAYIAHQRSSATPHMAAAALEAVYQFDARESAPAVRAPTLVLHRRGDRAIRLALGVATAQAIPGAHLEVLDGDAHHPWHGDAATFLRRAMAFDGVDEMHVSLSPGAVDAEAARRTQRPSPISARELEVLLLVAKGRTDAQIASELFLSVHTVHRHVANARTKLGVPSRSAAAAWAVANAR